ncbi:hypothetical protein FFF34_011690 [Inquilinus sp. KBS0705]|nr:hypothetical protein FFF34_011690 [Inquilinus sp. KBS0705]
MTTAQNLQNKLQTILSGDAWYGPNTYSLLDQIPFEAAYEKPSGSIHSIAGILLHMLGWTIEVTDRMNGQVAKEPTGGDWPDPGQPNEDKWHSLISDYKLANTVLSGVIQNFAEDKWQQPIKDARNRELGTGVSHLVLIEGLIQHHIYHSGQIALLSRIVGSL